MQWFEVDGYDPVGKKFFWNSYGSDGGVQTITYTIDNNNVPFTGTLVFGGKQFFLRGTSVFAPDQMTVSDKREVSVDGKTWMPLAESKSVKAKPSPK